MMYTPGPWTARKEGGTWYVEVGRDQDYFDICELFGGGIKMEANARLIAAAPEMLEALKVILGSKDEMVQWLIDNHGAKGIAGLPVAALHTYIAHYAIARVEGGDA